MKIEVKFKLIANQLIPKDDTSQWMIIETNETFIFLPHLQFKS